MVSETSRTSLKHITLSYQVRFPREEIFADGVMTQARAWALPLGKQELNVSERNSFTHNPCINKSLTSCNSSKRWCLRENEIAILRTE